MNPLEGKTKVEIEQLLQDYIATVNNPRYKGNMNVINSKFPEFQGMDVQLLQDYIATYNNPDYSGNYAVINSKFPEFFAGVKKKDQPQGDMDSSLEDGSSDLSDIPEFDPSTFNFDPTAAGAPRDTREDGYSSPVSTQNMGMYPDDIRLEQAWNQVSADIGFTQDNIRANAPDLALQQQQEAKAKEVQAELKNAEILGIQQDETFLSEISQIDASLIDKAEEEVVPFLIEKFKKYGFRFSESGIGDNVTVVAPDGVTTTTIDLDPWTSDGERQGARQLKNFIKGNLSSAPTKPITSEVQKAIRAKTLRDVPLKNEDGTVSTVRMTSFEEDGKHKVIPMLHPVNRDHYTSDGMWWHQNLTFDEALKIARERDEVFEFDTKEEAEAFAQGSWKNVATAEAEIEQFYTKRGLDYKTERKLLSDYDEAKSTEAFLSNAPFRLEDLSLEDQREYGKFYINGTLRQDAGELKNAATAKRELLVDAYLDDESMLAREEADLFLEKRRKATVGEAVKINFAAKEAEDLIAEKSQRYFGVNPSELSLVEPKNKREEELIKVIGLEYGAQQLKSQIAADSYEDASLFYDMKYDKYAQKEYAENWEGFQVALENGTSMGKAGDLILAATMYPEMMGGIDLDDPESTAKMAAGIVEYMSQSADKRSRVLNRWEKASNMDENWDVILDDPFEWMTSLAAHSISMMLPYGKKIIPLSMAAGTATGAALGASGFVTGPGGVLTTGAGAAAGFTWGTRTGFAATSLAMEYTNAVLEAITNQGFDITDPESVAKALNSEEVWAEGKERGFKRGIPIALVDLLTAKLAGNLIRVGSVASVPTRVAALTAERMIADPIGEGFGELAAQITVGDDINIKEIMAEMGGAMGNNTSNMSINLMLQAKSRNNIELASAFSDIEFMSNELSSGTKISAWANNMERLGKIDAETNQRIQMNVGLRKTARELLNNTGAFSRVKRNGAVETRVMQLLAAKDNMSSTPNRKAVFGPKISEINKELSDILTTRELKPLNEQTILAGQGVFSVGEQANVSDIREGLPSYKIKTNRFGRLKQVSKEEFVELIKNMNPTELTRISASVDNDDEVAKFVTNKLTEANIDEKRGTKRTTESTQETTESTQGTTESTQETTESTQTTESTPDTGTELVANNNGAAVSSKTQSELSPQPQIEQGTTQPQIEQGTTQPKIEQANQKQEVSDFEASLEEEEKGTKPKVDFRVEIDETTDENTKQEAEAEVTNSINAMESPNVDVSVTPEEMTSEKIDVEELNSRTDRPLKITNLKVVKGIPTMFSITDQLTTGTVTNPVTGNVISELKGAIGFNGTVGNEQAAWANVEEKEAQTIINRAEKIYQENEALFKEFWAKNPEYNGLVPMNIVKMGQDAMQSNEAVVRVLADNVSTLPKRNRRSAVRVLKTQMKQDLLKLKAKPEDKQNATDKKNIKNLTELLKKFKEAKVTTMDQALTPEFVENMSLPMRAKLVGYLTTGSIQEAKGKEKKVGGVSKNTKATVKELLKGVEKDAVKLNLAQITNLLTDPQLKNVPIGNVVSLVGVDVLNPGIIETTHPNYKYGVRGKSIGILENPQSMETVYPKAFEKIMAKMITSEEGGKKFAAKTVRTQTTGVGIGVPDKDYIGIMAAINPDESTKLNAFMNLAFPSVVINSDVDTFNNVMSQDNVRTYLRGDEIIYGVTVDGDIYINPEVHETKSSLYNTSIHEMGHVWTDYLQTTKKGREIYNRGAEVVQETDEFKKQLKRFDGDVDKATREAMAILIGNKGETIVNGSIKSKFSEWLIGMWNYIKSQFKMSNDLSAEEIQNLTLDAFLGTALADIFAGKPLKMTEAQTKALKNPEAMFSSGMNIDSIVKRGREQGINDESIRVVLKNRGFSTKEINNAMIVNLGLNVPMPRVFGDVNEGAKVGFKLFNNVRTAVNKFAFDKTGRIKTFSEIREKAFETLKADPIFKIQTEQLQNEMLVAFDRALGIRSNSRVSREISNIKKNLKQRKISADNITEAQRRMRTVIRKLLPAGKNYSKTVINRLLKTVNTTTPKNFVGKMSEVLKQVEIERNNEKNRVIKDILTIVKKKARKSKTDSGKVRSSGLDAIGQAYFSQVKEVLDAIMKQDFEALEQLADSVRDEKITEILQKQEQGKKLTSKEKLLLDRRIALDSFSDVMTMELEDVQELLQDVKSARKESIQRLNNRKEERRKKVEEKQKEFNEQMENDYSQLYDENGNPLNENSLQKNRQFIRKAFKENGLFGAVTAFFNQFKEDGVKDLTANGVAKFMQNYVTHFKTFTNILDKFKDGVFTETFYNVLNDFDERNLQGIRRTESDMNAMTNSTHGKKWTDWKYSLGTDVREFSFIDTKTGKRTTDVFNIDQAMRIYALSLNPTQAEKLTKMEIDIEAVKSFIGQNNQELVEQTVDFLSNKYFEETNSVYQQVNDVSLGYVENYFPTRTISKGAITNDMILEGEFNKVFTAEFSPALKERVDLSGDVLLGLSFSEVMEEHVKAMEKYKAYAVGVKEMNAILQDQGIQNLLNETGMKQLFSRSLNYAINPDSGPQVESADVVTRLQSLFTGFALALKVVQIPKQMSSFIFAWQKYQALKSGRYVPGLDTLGFMKDYAEVLFYLRTNIKEARDISASFDNRIKQGLEGDVFGLESGGRTFKKAKAQQGKKGAAARTFQKVKGFTTVAGDILGVLGYKALYNRQIRQGVDKNKALRDFNDYNSTQQSRRATEKVGLQQSTDALNRTFTMFGSSLFLMMNNVYQSSMSITSDIMKGPKGWKNIKRETARKFLLNYSLANVAFTAVSYAPALLQGKDGEKDRAYKALRDAALGLNLIYAIPVMGSAIETLISYIEKDRKPISDVVNPLTSVFRKMYKSMKDVSGPDGLVQSARVLLEIYSGMQLDAPIGLIKLLGGSGDSEDMYDALGITPSYRPGYGQSKTKSKTIKKKSTKAESKRTIKAIDPDLYEELYGKERPTYDAEQEVKAMKKEIRDEVKNSLK